MKEHDQKRIWMLVSAVLLAAAFITALVITPPVSFIEEVVVDGELPLSLERIAMRMKGLSRFGSDYRALKKELKESPYIGNVDFSMSDGILHVEVEESRKLIAITDGNRCLVYGEEDVHVPLDEDIPFIRKHMPVLEVSSGQLEYIARFGIEKRLSEVIDLILEIYHSSSYNDNLVGKVKYRSGTGEEFGHLDIIASSGDAVLHIREKVDPKMVLKSLSVMEEDERVLPTTEMREYELKGNTLTEQKRIVDGI